MEEFQIFFRRQNSPQKGAKLKLVPSRIQSRVCQHGDTDELDLIQNAPWDISAASAPSGLPAAIHMVPKFVCFVASERQNAIVGTDKTAHGASHTGISRVCLLSNAMIYLIDV
jgi:hypothetical protein